MAVSAWDPSTREVEAGGLLQGRQGREGREGLKTEPLLLCELLLKGDMVTVAQSCR